MSIKHQCTRSHSLENASQTTNSIIEGSGLKQAYNPNHRNALIRKGPYDHEVQQCCKHSSLNTVAFLWPSLPT